MERSEPLGGLVVTAEAEAPPPKPDFMNYIRRQRFDTLPRTGRAETAWIGRRWT